MAKPKTSKNISIDGSLKGEDFLRKYLSVLKAGYKLVIDMKDSKNGMRLETYLEKIKK